MSTAPKRLVNKSVGVFVPLLVLAGHNIATKRLGAHVKERRKTWVRHHLPAMPAHPDRLVFLVFFDEASVKNTLPRKYGRSLCGKRLEMNAQDDAWAYRRSSPV